MMLLLLITLAAAALKGVFFFSYHSTDLEVHRNWIALTHSLPASEWYFESTSKWTLDYPPFFAWFQWVLSHVAAIVDPEMVTITALPYSSLRTIAFMRSTVLVSEIMLFFSLWRLWGAFARLCGNCISKRRLPLTFVLFAFNFGLVLVDHIHFQYNGFLFGILFLSGSLLIEEQFILAAFGFTMLLNMKHIFIYVVPAYFIYFLFNYVFASAGRRFSGVLIKLLALGLTVFSVMALSLGPYYSKSHLNQLYLRLFPFGRGLTHTYWAPNVWAVYNFAEKVLCSISMTFHLERSFHFSLNRLTLQTILTGEKYLTLIMGATLVQSTLFNALEWSHHLAHASYVEVTRTFCMAANSIEDNYFHLWPSINTITGSLTSGLLGENKYVILPTVTPLHTAILSLVAMLPNLFQCARRSLTFDTVYAPFLGAEYLKVTIGAAWACFLFGWHVHEKAVLMFLLPLNLLAIVDPRFSAVAFYATTLGHYSLIPLIPTRAETPAVLSMFLAYTSVHWLALFRIPPTGDSSAPMKTKPGSKAQGFIGTIAHLHLWGLIPLYICCFIVWPLSTLHQRLPFFPNMATSVYTAVGLVFAFCYFIFQCFDCIRSQSVQTVAGTKKPNQKRKQNEKKIKVQ